MYSAGLDTLGSNSQPHQGKAKSIPLLSTDNGQMPKGWQGKGDVQASNWSTHKLGNLFTTLYNGFLGDLQKKSFKVKIKKCTVRCSWKRREFVKWYTKGNHLSKMHV